MFAVAAAVALVNAAVVIVIAVLIDVGLAAVAGRIVVLDDVLPVAVEHSLRLLRRPLQQRKQRHWGLSERAVFSNTCY